MFAAGGTDSPPARAAMEQLCRAYWYSLYVYARRRGNRAHDAQDHTQEFLAGLLQHNHFARLSRERGRFRSYLLGAFQHFLAGQWDRARAQKRGGGQPVLSWDELQAEERFALEPASDETPERNFDQRWALSLMEAALARLRAEHADTGKLPQFERLELFLSTEGNRAEYDRAAQDLNLTPGAVPVSVHRLRQRYAEIVRSEVAQTVATPADLEAELHHLFTLQP